MGNICASGGPAGGGGGGSDLGQFIADFAAENEGQKVASEMQGTTECWDLAMAAIEHAKAAGYEGIDWNPDSSYEWGPNVVDYQSCEPGDIVQWTSYSEKTTSEDGSSWSSLSAGFPNHTSIVAEPYDSASGEFRCWGQNPDPVHFVAYHPDSSTGGSFIVYRLYASGGSGNDDEQNGGDDEYQYYDPPNGNAPYYWKAAPGYDPHTDGYYYYYYDGGSEDDAQWYAIPQ